MEREGQGRVKPRRGPLAFARGALLDYISDSRVGVLPK
jgi:hypothetical protein